MDRSVKSNMNKEINENKRIDIVVPCHNEEKNIMPFFDAVNAEKNKIEGYDFSYIFIDDGSSDKTLERIKELAGSEDNRDTAIRYISFSRNFGKEAAIYAGLRASAEGCGGKAADYTILMDADLQHPPRLIPEMIRAVEQEGFDSCAARRVSRKGEPRIRSAFSSLFYKLMNRFCDIDIVDGATDFRIMSRRMVKAIVSMPESQRFSKGIFAWVGFRTKWIEMENVERKAGESSWSMWKLLSYAVAGFLDFAEAPLKLAGFIGGIVSVLAGVYLVLELIKTIVVGKDLPGYESLICLVLIFGGIIIALLSIIGEYIGRMYLEMKGRPIYIAKETGDNISIR